MCKLSRRWEGAALPSKDSSKYFSCACQVFPNFPIVLSSFSKLFFGYFGEYQGVTRETFGDSGFGDENLGVSFRTAFMSGTPRFRHSELS